MSLYLSLLNLGYVEIAKSLRRKRSHLVPRRIVDKNGKRNTVWVNPEKERLERLKKVLAARPKAPRKIPMIELEPLPDISESEIQRLTNSTNPAIAAELQAILKDRLLIEGRRIITNKNTRVKLVITTKGISKSIRPYTNRHTSPETKASLFYLDKLLENAICEEPEENIHKDSTNIKKRNIEHVDVYVVKYLLNGKRYQSTMKVRVFPPTRDRNFTKHNFHFAKVEEIKTDLTVHNATGYPLQGQGAEPFLKRSVKPPSYPQAGEESREGKSNGR